SLVDLRHRRRFCVNLPGGSAALTAVPEADPLVSFLQQTHIQPAGAALAGLRGRPAAAVRVALRAGPPEYHGYAHLHAALRVRERGYKWTSIAIPNARAVSSRPRRPSPAASIT